MAGYGLKLDFDEAAMNALPIGKDPDSTAQRKKMFQQADMNGNGICSLAECDRLVVTVLNIEGVKAMKPVINRAFHAARDIVPSVGSISPHYVDFNEFRYFLIYLKHYLELFLVFDKLDIKDKGGGRYSDRRLSYPEFEQAIPQILKWGVESDVAKMLKTDPRAVFRAMDDNGGGVVLFDEFAHWALWNHIFSIDGDDDGMEEALEVLRKQKPNLCGKDLSSIKASKAKYRVDARISGQGCLGGDPSLAGGYDDIPDGGAELAAGRHYPGGLAAWKASFHGQGKDKPGNYRTVGETTFVSSNKMPGGDRLGTLPCGTEIEVLEVEELDEKKRVRARIAKPAGWISLLNTRNGFRWAVHLRAAPSKGSSKEEASNAALSTAWRDSLARVEEANEVFAQNGIPECINGCGQPRFGRYPTCCTHCKGPTGPHAHSCKKTGYDPCKLGCGHPQFGKYDTCCTHCKGPAGPHARGCEPLISAPAKTGAKSSSSLGEKSRSNSGGAYRSTGRFCEQGCGRQPFKTYPTCCTHCKGASGPHARDCDKRLDDEGPVREMRNMFYSCQDKDGGLSYSRFRQILEKLMPSTGDIDAMIATCDADHNGTIDIDEFLNWLQTGELDNEAKDKLRHYRDS